MRVVPRSALDAYELLSRVLLWAAALVLGLAVVGGVAVAASDSSVPFLQDVERESRGIATLGILASGVAAAGVLSGLGAILHLLVAFRRDAERADAEEVGPAP